jgi:ATP-dependent protease ClpP protease subunit
MKEKNEEACEGGEYIMPPTSPFGPASPIVTIKNHVYFYDEIDTTVARTFFATIHETAMNIIDTAVENNFPIIPIHLHINSCGGSCSDALAIVQGIEDIQEGRIHQVCGIPIKIPVYTYIEGEADSAASLIACVGTKRFCSRHALSLIHDVRQISGGQVQKTDDIELEAKNLKMFKEKLYDIYLSHSKLSREELEKIASKEDYSTPEELLKYGLIDEII